MSQTENPRISAISQSPEMPTRQVWDADNSLNIGADHTYAETAKETTVLSWNEWADSAESILHDMINHIEESDISYDAYLTLIRHLAAYPKRPVLPDVDNQEEPDSLIGAWSEWADAVERVVHDMKRAIEHSVPLPREEQMLCADEPIDFSLDLSNQHPPPMHMAAHLRMMLMDGTGARDGLADFIEELSI